MSSSRNGITARSQNYSLFNSQSLVNEPLANEAFKTIDEVEELVAQRCRRLLKQQQLIQGLTFYHWWPEVEAVA